MSDDEQAEELNPVNENRWYCLATFYGEQAERATLHDYDEKLADRNRMAWNRWVAGALNDYDRAEIIKKGFPEAELIPFNREENTKFLSDFCTRMKSVNAVLPDADNIADFNNNNFNSLIVFNGFLFKGGASFNSATFYADASFKLAPFLKAASFHSTIFARHADFTSANFSGVAYFDFAKFSGDALFTSANFSEVANFISARFLEVARFKSAKVAGHAYFSSAKFSKDAYFIEAKFLQDAYFNFAKFYGNWYFPSVIFSQDARFISAKFHGNGNFYLATFSGNAFFNPATFFGSASFHSATFSNGQNFQDAEFKKETVFAEAKFLNLVPDFRGAKMHEATEWHGVTWPDPPKDKNNTAQYQVYTYERLKQEMERLKKHEDEQFFFRKELRARRELERPKSLAWWVNYAYEKLSDYGQSISRPLYGFVILFLFGIVAETIVFYQKPMSLPEAAGISFANIFSFLPIKRAPIEDLDAGLILCAVQSIFAALLLFLLGLALRGKFRMR